MKKLLKLCYIILLVTVFISLNINIVNAASSAKIELKTIVNSIKPEDTLQVEIRLVNVNIGAGATGVKGTLNYDKNVLELLEEDQQNNVINGWTKSYNEKNGVILIDRANNAKEDQTIAVLKFKVKKDAEVDKNTTILLKDIEVNDENETISTDNAQLEIKVTKVEENKPNENNTDTEKDKQDENKDSSTDKDTSKDNTDNKDKDSSKKDDTKTPSDGSKEPNNDNTGDGNNNNSNNNNKKDESVNQNKENVDNQNNNNKNNNKEDANKDNTKQDNTKQDNTQKEAEKTQATSNSTNSSKNIPKLGIADNIVPILIISAIIIVGAISFIKYRKYKGI